MKVAFWTNGGGAGLGIGHLMRCIAIADALKERGVTSFFISKDLSVGVDLILSNGYDVRITPSKDPSAVDLPWAVTYLKDANVIVTDSHQLTTKHYTALKNTGIIIAAIDDAINQKLPVDMVIGNAYASLAQYSPFINNETAVLAGPSFLPMQKKYRNLPAHKIAPTVNRLLVTMGGEDPVNATKKVLEAIASFSHSLSIDVILGPAYANKDSLNGIRKNPKHQLTLHENVRDMLGFYMNADAAITAPGTSFWELASAGVPMLVIQTAENQSGVAGYAQKYQLAKVLGSYDAVSEDEIINGLACLLDQNTRNKLRERCQTEIDGRGAERIAESLVTSYLELADTKTLRYNSEYDRLEFRPADQNPIGEESRLMWQWRNDPMTKQMSRNTDEISWEHHIEWYKDLMKNNKSKILIGTLYQIPLCVVRLDPTINESDSAEISINLAPRMRGKGLGPQILQKACQFATKEMGLQSIKATIKENNSPSIKAFKSAGFFLESKSGAFSTYLWRSR